MMIHLGLESLTFYIRGSSRICRYTPWLSELPNSISVFAVCVALFLCVFGWHVNQFGD